MKFRNVGHGSRRGRKGGGGGGGSGRGYSMNMNLLALLVRVVLKGLRKIVMKLLLLLMMTKRSHCPYPLCSPL
jgi:hypothetical protein